MRVKFKLTEQDAANIQRSSSRPLWALLAFGLLLLVMFGGGVFFIQRDIGDIGWVLIIASILLCIVAYGLPRFQLRKTMRTEPVLQSEIEYGFSDECVQVIQATGETKLWWTGYKKYKETERLFVVFISSARIYIPKRVMLPQQMEELRRLLDEKIKSSNAVATT